MDRTSYLPRLDRTFYQGDAVVHWTMPILNRRQGWLTPEFHAQFRELALHMCVRQHLALPVYVLMPDHLHFIAMGLAPTSDQLKAIVFLRTYLGRILGEFSFQKQAYDHVFKEEERRRNAIAKTCQYILLNPVRANLTSDPRDWKFSGSVVAGYPDLNPNDDSFWELFWRIYPQAPTS